MGHFLSLVNTQESFLSHFQGHFDFSGFQGFWEVTIVTNLECTDLEKPSFSVRHPQDSLPSKKGGKISV